MFDERDVPKNISLEGRANLIADAACRIYHGDPAARRKAVHDEALAHLRVVAAQAASSGEAA